MVEDVAAARLPLARRRVDRDSSNDDRAMTAAAAEEEEDRIIVTNKRNDFDCNDATELN